MPPFLHAIDLDRLVALRRHAELAGVIEVQRQDVRLRFVLVVAMK